MKKAIKRISGLLAGFAVFLVPLQVFAAEEEETMKQKMAFAAQNTAVGIITVFLMLLLMAGIIYLLRYLPKLVNFFRRKDKAEGEQEKEPEPEPAARRPEPVSLTDDAELVAVITAAIAAMRAECEQAPAGTFVVRTIKKRA